MLIVNPSPGIKPQLWVINPGIVADNASRMALPMPEWLGIWGGGSLLPNLSGNGGDGTVSVFDWVGGSLYYGTASDQVVSLPATYTPLDGGTAFTVVAKIKSINLSADNGIFYTSTHGADRPLLLWMDNAEPDHFGALVTTNAGTTGGLYSNLSLVVNTWYIVVLTWDGATVRLYIDGIEDTAGSFPAAIAGTLDNTLDNYKFGNTSALDKELIGYLDYGSLYTQALTPTQVATISADPYGLVQMPRRIWAVEVAVGLSIPVAMYYQKQHYGVQL